MVRFVISLLSFSFTLNIFSQVDFVDYTDSIMGDFKTESKFAMGISDLDGDGKDDIIIVDQASYLKVYKQNAAGQLFDYSINAQPGISSEWSLVTGDLDNDGIQEIIVSGTNADTFKGSKIYFVENGKYKLRQQTPFLFSQSANLVDLNNDGYLDLFVCNDLGPSKTYINDGTGHLVEEEVFPFEVTSGDDQSGNYSSVFCDIDSDEHMDLFMGKCSVYASSPDDPRRINRWYKKKADGIYMDVAADFGLDDGSQTWAVDIADLNNTGQLDILVGNHHSPSKIMWNHLSLFMRDTLQNAPDPVWQILAEDMDNNGFKDIIYISTNKSYIYYNFFDNFVQKEIFPGLKSSSVAVGDLNSDGFLDLILNDITDPLDLSVPNISKDKVLINQGNNNHFLRIKLEGTQSNRDAIGAKVFVTTKYQTFYQQIKAGRSYGIMNSTTAHFGLGQDTTLEGIGIKWPMGDSTFISADTIDIDTQITIKEPTSSPVYDLTPKDFSLDVSPNPNQGQFYVNISTPDPAELSVIDLNGRIVFQKTIPTSGMYDIKHFFHSGVYIVQCKTHSKTIQKTIIVN